MSFTFLFLYINGTRMGVDDSIDLGTVFEGTSSWLSFHTKGDGYT